MPQDYHKPHIPLDPGHSRGWSSARIWRWLLPAERERVERHGLYLNVLEPPGRPARAS